MKTLLKSTPWLFFFCCWWFIQCSENSDPPATPQSSAKSLTNPVIDGVTSASASYDAATFTHTLTVPVNTNVTALRVAFTLPTGATVKPASRSAQNFATPVSYTVTAEDNTTQPYTVKVVVQEAPKSSEKQITSFVFAALNPVVSASIAQTTRVISATVPAQVNLTALAPTISISEKATVKPASGVAQNFTVPMSYTVTAEDGSQQVYEVKVEKQTVNTSCRLSKLEFESGSSKGEYIYEYNASNLISKIKITSANTVFEVNITYNQNNQITNWAFIGGSLGSGTYKCFYNNGKFNRIEQYDLANNLLNKYDIEVDAQGYVVKSIKNYPTNLIVTENYSYNNGNLIKLSQNFGQYLNVINVEYNSNKHYLAGYQGSGEFAFLHRLSFSVEPYGTGNLFPLIGTNSISKSKKENDIVAADYSYEFNSNGYPSKAIENRTNNGGDKTVINWKFTYSNCQ